jgi:hypothetical protein
MAMNGSSTLGNIILPSEQGLSGLDSHHTRSPTAISESATLSGGTGSAFAGNSKGAGLEGLPEAEPLPINGTEPAKLIPNVTVPAEHNNRTLVLCFDGTGDQ